MSAPANGPDPAVAPAARDKMTALLFAGATVVLSLVFLLITLSGTDGDLLGAPPYGGPYNFEAHAAELPEVDPAEPPAIFRSKPRAADPLTFDERDGGPPTDPRLLPPENPAEGVADIGATTFTLIPRSDSSAVTSVENDLACDTITMPSDSIPTNSSPMAVSSRTMVRFETTVMLALITNAATNAPTIGLNPHSTANAIPGITPCANASPRKLSPRSTTQVPTSEVATPAMRLPIKARCMNAGSKASIRKSTAAG